MVSNSRNQLHQTTYKYYFRAQYFPNPFCQQASWRITLAPQKQFPNILIVFVDFPILSETSELAARAALAADKQEAYFKFHTILLNNSNAISEDFLLKTAKSLDLNIKKFKNDMQSQQTKNAIKNNIQFANSLKIRGTPTFIIGNQILPGAYDYDKLKNIILNNS